METASDAEGDGGASQEFESVYIKEEDVEVTISEADVSSITELQSLILALSLLLEIHHTVYNYVLLVLELGTHL
jgi:hypothetical protein